MVSSSAFVLMPIGVRYYLYVHFGRLRSLFQDFMYGMIPVMTVSGVLLKLMSMCLASFYWTLALHGLSEEG